MLTKGVAWDAALPAATGRAVAEHRVQEGELWWRAWNGILQPLCLGAPQPLGSTAAGKILRQANITFVILKLPLTGTLLVK